MTLFSLVLYLHVLSALLLAAALTLESVTLARLSRARSQSQASMWVDLVPGFPLLAIGSLLVLLFSGGYLTARMLGWSLGWPRAAVLAVLLFALLGAASGRQMRRIRRMVVNQGAQEPLSLARLKHALLKLSFHLRVGVLAGTVLLMAAKPDFFESLEILAAAITLSSLSGLVALRRARIPPSPNAELGA